MGDSGHNDKKNPDKVPERSHRESPRPSSSSDYTYVYPVRSLLSDVQPATDDSSNPSPSLKNDFSFLSEALEGDRSAQLRRAAQWQADISSPSTAEQPHSSQQACNRDPSLPLEPQTSNYSSVIFGSRATHQASRTTRACLIPATRCLFTNFSFFWSTEYTSVLNVLSHLKSEPEWHSPSSRNASPAVFPPESNSLPPASITSSQGKPIHSDPGLSPSSLVDYVHLGPVRLQDQRSECSSRSSRSTTALSRSRRRYGVRGTQVDPSSHPSPELDSESVDFGALSISDSNGLSSGGASRGELSIRNSDPGFSEEFYKAPRSEAAELANGAGRVAHVYRFDD